MIRRLVVTATDRPYYFQAALNSWTRSHTLRDWEPTVFLEPTTVHSSMARLATHAGFHVQLNPQRRGVLRNPWHALNTAFTQGADFAVLAEDDVIVSDDTLDYFTWAGTALQNHHILAACASSMRPTSNPDETGTVITTQHFNPLVWGTWADRWNTVLRDTWDHDYSSGTPEAPQSGWDWNINLRVMRDWHVASPLASRSTHIGQYGGTHMQPHQFAASVAPTFTQTHHPNPFLLAPTNR